MLYKTALKHREKISEQKTDYSKYYIPAIAAGGALASALLGKKVYDYNKGVDNLFSKFMGYHSAKPTKLKGFYQADINAPHMRNLSGSTLPDEAPEIVSRVMGLRKRVNFKDVDPHMRMGSAFEKGKYRTLISSNRKAPKFYEDQRRHFVLSTVTWDKKPSTRTKMKELKPIIKHLKKFPLV